MREVSCWAAFLVNVSPRTLSGSTNSFATIHTTRAAIVSVLPAPAPATTSVGPGGAAITAACSAVGGCFWPRARESSIGSMRAALSGAADVRPGLRRDVNSRSPVYRSRVLGNST